MIKYFQNKFEMTEKGASDLTKAIFWSTLQDLSFMLPLFYGFYFLDRNIQNLISPDPGFSNNLLSYILFALCIMAVIMFVTSKQYDANFVTIYEESAKVRINLAEKLRKLPLSFFAKKDISDLSATIMEDATEIENIFSHAVPKYYAAFIHIFVIAIMLFIYNYKMALALFWVTPIAGLIVILSNKFQNTVHQNIYKIKRSTTEKIQEGLDLAAEIKSYNQEEIYSDNLDKKLDDYEKYLVNVEIWIAVIMNAAHMLLNLGLPTVIIYGGYLFSKGEIPVIVYISYMVIACRIYDPIADIMNYFAAFKYLDVRIHRMKEMNSLPVQEGSSEFEVDNYDIEFSNVHFSYDDEKETIKDVSFIAKQGEVTALVGPSGGGKTTVAKLAVRFWDINSGKITLGGKDISKADPETLFKNFSIVFQDVTLFNSTVMDNIRIGKKDATDEEVLRAAQIAQCDEFVNKLPQGYNTLIGENGEKLSGGERQRISIARVILKDAPIILLDEATASLDTENETKIQKALSSLIAEKTVMIIAHRMRTVAAADKIIVLKDGEIIETGSGKDLRESNGFFKKMMEYQLQN